MGVSTAPNQNSTAFGDHPSMRISVIIPTLNEARSIARLVEALTLLDPDELIVVDGGSADGTREICRSLKVALMESERGRGRQMNAGAQRASGDVLLFLHADTRLPASAFDDIRQAMADEACVGGRFDLQLEGEQWLLRAIGTMINLRSRLTKVATGDQAIFVRREIFEKIGGYPDIPLMEDFAFSCALKKRGKIACLKSQVTTSARRWKTQGVWRTIFRMWAIKLLYLSGISPARLTRYYGDVR